MKERPILFSAPMVRALLDRTKTQTRRVCKSAETHTLSSVVEVPDPKERGQVYNGSHFGDEEGDVVFASPYGGVGDRLWVREAHAPRADCLISWQRSMAEAYNRMQPTDLCYRADEKATDWVEKWRPSIHMPRWASRILLEITDVRVQRLQDISEGDAEAEGCVETHPGDWLNFAVPGDKDASSALASAAFRLLWERINGPGSWSANPWVWAVSFRRITS